MLSYLQQLDVKLFYLINGLPHAPIPDGAAAAVHVLTYRGPIYYPIAALYLRSKNTVRRRLVVLATIAAPVTSFIANIILKPSTHRLRPFQLMENVIVVANPPHSYSFPSGQTAVAFSLATLYWLLPFPKWEKVVAALFALIVALDRVYTGHHFPSDVAGGATLGSLVSYLVYRVFNWRAKRVSRVPNKQKG